MVLCIACLSQVLILSLTFIKIIIIVNIIFSTHYYCCYINIGCGSVGFFISIINLFLSQGLLFFTLILIPTEVRGKM